MSPPVLATVRRTARRSRLLPAIALLAGCAGHTLTIRNDNDIYAIPNSDRFYTQGFQVEWGISEADTRAHLGGLATSMPLFGAAQHPFATVVVGQKIFTPENTSQRAPILNDRPYAGWLFGGLRLQNVTAGDRDTRADRLDTWELDLGIVGPSSLASKAQRAAHRLYGDRPPQGWTNQLHDEPGLELRFERSYRLFYHEVGGPLHLQVDALGDVGFSLGNILTAARTRARLRFGGLRRDFDTNGGTPTWRAIDDGSIPPAWPFYGFFGVEGRAVGRNLFLDGNTYRSSQSVDKEPLLLELSAGLVVPFDSVKISFSMTVTSPEFEETDSWQRFGSVQMEFTF